MEILGPKLLNTFIDVSFLWAEKLNPMMFLIFDFFFVVWLEKISPVSTVKREVARDIYHP